MGVIRGVNPGNEPLTKGYLHGQLWNRPVKKKDRWVLFRTEHLYYPASFPGHAIKVEYSPAIDNNGIKILPSAGNGLPYESIAVPSLSKVRITEAEPYYNYQATSDISIPWKSQQIYERIKGASVRVGNVIGFKLSDLERAVQGANLQPTYSIEFSYDRVYDFALLDGYGLFTYIIPMVFVSMQLADVFEVTPLEDSPYLIGATTQLYHSRNPGLALLQLADTVPSVSSAIGGIPGSSISECLVFKLDLVSPTNSSYYLFPDRPPAPIFIPPPGTSRTWQVIQNVYNPPEPLVLPP